ncbi:MAG: tetratricopeptide repeat protein [Melioribacteraceae bacterium]|nr:tetratricopeptide repeat protein [Melioribacteraceae bacterium]
MSSDQEKIKADKFALIYEFNKTSPLFTRVAAGHLQSDETSKALGILEDGIKIHPYYPTAIILYSIALAKAGKKEEARNTIDRLDDITNNVKLKEYYLNKIEQIVKLDENVDFKVSENLFTDADKTDDHQPTKTRFERINSDDEEDELQQLARKLQDARIPEVGEEELKQEEPEQPHFPGKSLVSETLAKIYFNQGNYNEALSIYETLLEIQPSNKEYYQKQIDQIKNQMGRK